MCLTPTYLQCQRNPGFFRDIELQIDYLEDFRGSIIEFTNSKFFFNNNQTLFLMLLYKFQIVLVT